jgi:hypothetical protein
MKILQRKPAVSVVPPDREGLQKMIRNRFRYAAATAVA